MNDIMKVKFLHSCHQYPFLKIVNRNNKLSKPELSPERNCTKEILKVDAALSCLKWPFTFQMGNTGSFSHFCSNQAITDEVNYL
jgi:hypothetical protein